ncbi:type 1 glutamine amidotransferase [Dysgonomonas sp. ZJ709]|uniref:type 1 glutamine amidotransferase n=1 Tax=Dysgonomonas sp. ZJ709 TaxID=2709797 RepID=UPI001C883868|nr:amidotransferase [Dysgonomonas sp. ZJ709]
MSYSFHQIFDKMNRRVHYIQHVAFEGLGYLETYVIEKGYSLSVSRMYEDYKFPNPDSFDLLIIMGGPMGAYEDDKYAWLKEEKAFIRSTIDAGKVVLGICLGSQILASVLGAEVYPNKEKEIGWLPVTFTNQSCQNFFDSREKSQTVFQYHGDTFDLPENAKLLATSEVCANQAFLYKDKVLGLQFHLEVTEPSCIEMLDNGSDDWEEGEYIQSQDLIRTNMHNIPLCNQMIKSVLEKLTDKI